MTNLQEEQNKKVIIITQEQSHAATSCRVVTGVCAVNRPIQTGLKR